MNRWEAILFFAALLFPFAFFWVVWHKWQRFGAVLLAVYVLSYLPFTLAGRYVIANHGGSDWRREWVPKFLVVAYLGLAGREKTRFTLGGAAYWPCILLDHMMWHRTFTDHIFDEASKVWTRGPSIYGFYNTGLYTAAEK